MPPRLSPPNADGTASKIVPAATATARTKRPRTLATGISTSHLDARNCSHSRGAGRGDNHPRGVGQSLERGLRRRETVKSPFEAADFVFGVASVQSVPAALVDDDTNLVARARASSRLR